MNFKVNDKINQVTEKTLVVGMDIAKETHYASFVDERGRALAKVTSVKQSHAGFEYLYAQIRKLLSETGKSEVIVGIEPTGHYWMNLAYYLADLGIPLVMVNPLHVKRSKELDDNLQTKNDKKDSMVIAKLIKDGRFSYPRILRDVDAELRVGSTYRANLTEELGAIKNRLIRWLDRYFPEFRQVFPSFGKMALAVLECTPFPSEVVGKSSEELLSLYREVDGLKSPQLPKTKKLMEVAASSIGITEGRVMARMELATLLRNYHQVVVQDEIASTTEFDYSFIWMSDTQYYSESYPQIFDKMTKWMAEAKDNLNLKYVFHTGDLVDEADQQIQWDRADAFMGTLDEAAIPYGVLAGNHDVGQKTGDYNEYSKYFGEQRFNNKDYYGESYKNNRGHYDLISSNGNDFIMMYMGWGVNDEDIAWINKILAQHPERKAILSFHEYLLVSGNRSPIGDQLFKDVVTPNENVIAVLSGHYHDAETLVDEIDDDADGIADRKVYQMLADYQGGPEGGQ
jgi:transposase